MADGLNKGQGARAEGCGERGKPHRFRVARFAMFTVFCLMACAPPAVAADMGDPTRPPAGFSEKAQAAEAPQEAALLVSSVFLMGARPYAILDGQVVRVGDRLEAGRIRKIDESGVWLKTPTGMRQLKLLPDVKKTPAGHGKKKVEKR